MATKEADVLEKQRRMAWEKEQEERFSKREAELEKQVQEMQEEIDRLKAHINSAPSPSPSGVYTPIASSESETPSVGETFPEAPLSPESTSFHQVPQFVEGSSRHAVTEQTRPLDNSQEPSPGSGTASEVPLLAYPLTPRGFSAEPTSLPSTAQSNVRKRHSPPMYSDSEEESTSDTSDASPMDNPKKRRNGHDKSIRTVHVCTEAQIPVVGNIDPIISLARNAKACLAYHEIRDR